MKPPSRHCCANIVRALAFAAMLAVAAPAAAAPAAAGPPPHMAVGLPAADMRQPRSEAPKADRGLRPDQSSRVFEATGVQTLTVIGLAGGAAAIGAIAAGTPGALAGVGAIIMIYTLMR